MFRPQRSQQAPHRQRLPNVAARRSSRGRQVPAPRLPAQARQELIASRCLLTCSILWVLWVVSSLILVFLLSRPSWLLRRLACPSRSSALSSRSMFSFILVAICRILVDLFLIVFVSLLPMSSLHRWLYRLRPLSYISASLSVLSRRAPVTYSLRVTSHILYTATHIFVLLLFRYTPCKAINTLSYRDFTTWASPDNGNGYAYNRKINSCRTSSIHVPNSPLRTGCKRIVASGTSCKVVDGASRAGLEDAGCSVVSKVDAGPGVEAREGGFPDVTVAVARLEHDVAYDRGDGEECCDVSVAW